MNRNEKFATVCSNRSRLSWYHWFLILDQVLLVILGVLYFMGFFENPQFTGFASILTLVGMYYGTATIVPILMKTKVFRYSERGLGPINGYKLQVSNPTPWDLIDEIEKTSKHSLKIFFKEPQMAEKLNLFTRFGAGELVSNVDVVGNTQDFEKFQEFIRAKSMPISVRESESNSDPQKDSGLFFLLSILGPIAFIFLISNSV
ncbi:MAG: hypothetical protein AB7O96_13735 [Pseudobdellovibrionaceae bacterium]